MVSSSKRSSSKVFQKRVKIYGVVTDFNGNPIDAADVKLLNERFETITSTVTEKSGAYALEVNAGLYYALIALRMCDYAKVQS